MQRHERVLKRARFLEIDVLIILLMTNAFSVCFAEQLARRNTTNIHCCKRNISNLGSLAKTSKSSHALWLFHACLFLRECDFEYTFSCYRLCGWSDYYGACREVFCVHLVLRSVCLFRRTVPNGDQVRKVDIFITRFSYLSGHLPIVASFISLTTELLSPSQSK